MYGWIFRHLPGPTWLKAVEALVLVAAAVLVLFQWVFPWAQAYWDLGGAGVSGQ
ncbi:hypothetical protein ACFQ23_09665 [Schaalia naturae]|jgi:hypothetical protein|uniref:Uncharacterized protein n=1 Tax=Schaalia naturae TaxID=635203 RepID=A0ABW2SP41_9ACTO